jgi:hypothetical protein
MKKILIYSSIIVSLVMATTGCQKDIDVLATAKAGATPAIGFGFSNLDALSIGVEASATQLDTTIKIFSSSSSSAATVTVAVDTSIVGSYNADNGTEYDYLPASIYTLPTSVAIPANSKEGDLKLSVDITKFLNFGTEFALGLTITKVTGGAGAILTDHSKLFVVIQVKNPYDADYSVTGYLFHPTASRAIKLTKHLTTAGAITSYGDVGDLGASGYQFQFDVTSANQLTNWVSGGATPAPPKAGFMALDNGGGLDFTAAANGVAPTNPGTAPYTVTTYNNTYDPSSSTFWMHYGYYSAGNPLSGTGEVTYSRLVYEKWVRQ